MREILFRGYNKETKKWYYGMLGKFDNKYFIDDGTGTKPFVEEKSIGQYTGFVDEDGEKIFEGDIIDAGFGVVLTVEFDYIGEWIAKNEDREQTRILYELQLSSMCRVIGNKYEHSEAE